METDKKSTAQADLEKKHDTTLARLLGTVMGTATGIAIAIWLTYIIRVG